MNTDTHLIPIGEAAKMLQVSIATLRRWERQGKISAVRTLGGQRRYDAAIIESLKPGAKS